MSTGDERLSPAVRARAEEYERLNTRCQWYGDNGRCPYFGTHWELGKGRYCERHARLAGLRMW